MHIQDENNFNNKYYTIMKEEYENNHRFPQTPIRKISGSHLEYLILMSNKHNCHIRIQT